ncbi:MAG: hypothetical protein NE334_02430 [Lentisphaeraceae bacterium]|nr:hypothetical protein [Lentisphaeraceae bacterium]
MKICFLFFCLFVTGCTTVTFQTHNPTPNSTVITGTQESLFKDCEKLSLEVSKNQSGRIENFRWQGKELLSLAQVEQFPNTENDFKKNRVLIIDDNEGLLIADVRARGSYQFRRSYSLYFDENTDEYVVEVIYNVKNQSSETPLNFNWSNSLKFIESLDKNDAESFHFKGLKLQLRVYIEGISRKSSFDPKTKTLSTSTSSESTIGTKERKSWKVQFRFKDLS